jgi:hypothetical protein
MNCYANIADLKSSLGVTSTTDDTIMRKNIDAASRMIDRYCGRRFYVTSETKYFDGRTPLWIPDLLAVTTLKTDDDGDATFENTFATTDYLLYGPGEEDALNRYPRIRIELSTDSDYGSFGAGKKSVEIVGTWGYGDGISATPYLIDTTTNEALDASEVGVDVTAATNLSAGQTILIESEQMFIESITTTTLTVIRGVNGTTAATHDTAKAIYIYQYPFDVWECCLALSSAIYQNRNKQGIQSERLGDYSYSLSKEQVKSICNDYVLNYRIIRV